MRPELNQIERIESYLAGNFSSEEKTAFEAEIDQNPELASALENQKLLQRAISRAGLKTIITANSGIGIYEAKASKMSKTKKWGWFLSVMVVLVSTSIGLLNLTNERPNSENAKYIAVDSNSSAINNLVAQESDTAAWIQSNAQGENTIANQKERVNDASSLKNELQPWIPFDKQSFEINPKETSSIIGEDGTVIIIPMGAFVDKMILLSETIP